MEGYEGIANQLTFSQQFELRAFQERIANISLEEAKELLIGMRCELFIQKQMTRIVVDEQAKMIFESDRNSTQDHQ